MQTSGFSIAMNVISCLLGTSKLLPQRTGHKVQEGLGRNFGAIKKGRLKKSHATHSVGGGGGYE